MSCFIVLYLDCIVCYYIEVEQAVANLNGRWFGGKTIRAEIYDDEKFEADDLTA